jgi:hypothetical protein
VKYQAFSRFRTPFSRHSPSLPCAVEAFIMAQVIPQYLFDAPDASTHIFEYLNTYNSTSGFGGSGTPFYTQSNWTSCEAPGLVFSSAPLFTGCLLYPNVTRNVNNGTLPESLKEIGFGSTDLSLHIQSAITTCFAAYCARSDNCRDTYDCNAFNLLTGNHELSAQGVANCWTSFCTGSVMNYDQDIAGIGVRTTLRLQLVESAQD